VGKKPLDSLKVAIVHDWLVTIAGAEKVLIELLELFPQADLFSIVEFLSPLERKKLLNKKAKTTFIQHLPFSSKFFRNYLPFFPLAIEKLELKEYDLIISSSWAFAKGIKKEPHQKHICYCHTPIRYAWDLFEEYTSSLPPIKKQIVRIILKNIRLWDIKTSKNVDLFIANSSCVQERIKRIYKRKAVVINPPIDTYKFEPWFKKEDYYLTLSRLVPYKKTALIVEAFNNMPDKKLIVVGKGEELSYLQKIAKSNIQVLGYQEDKEVVNLMQRAKGFVYGALEDFGIVMGEALSTGTPVIAYGKCGALDIVKEGKNGIFFHEQTPQEIIKAVKKFEEIEFDYEIIRNSALKFSRENFRKKVKKVIGEIF